MPGIVEEWLGYVPAAILSALAEPLILLRDGRLSIDLSNDYLMPSIIALVVAVRWRSLLAAVLVGMASIVIFRNTC